MAAFSVIVPTAGRRTLRYTLESISPQLQPGDELIVVCNRDGDFGNRARNSGIERARGTHIVFLDDDDEWTPDALARMRRFADQHPDRVGIFRFRSEYGEMPDREHLRATGSPNYVVPNVEGKVGRFLPADLTDPECRPLRPGETPEYLAQRFGDFEFIRSTLELRGDEPVWVPEVTTILRAERNPLRRLRYRLRLGKRLRQARGLAATALPR